MKRMSTSLRLSLCGALVTAAVGAVAIAAAQTTASGNLTTAAPTAAKKPPTSATAEMVNEAIQRSEARAAKAKQSGTTEQWGTEEPFTYNPAIRRFNANQQ